MRRPISRRDFLNASALGIGAGLLGLALPSCDRNTVDATAGSIDPNWHPWTGPGGIGDYARSNGNTWEVMSIGHDLRDGTFNRGGVHAIDDSTDYDVVIVGGGFSGLGAAFQFALQAGDSGTCLVLDNHPVFGGEAKQNEFMVDGQRLIGPQGSNAFAVPSAPTGSFARLYDSLGLPQEFRYAEAPAEISVMEFPRDNYEFLLWADRSESFGIYVEAGGRAWWVRNPWEHGFQGMPFPEHVRRDFFRWRSDSTRHYPGEAWESWLDTMSYEEYLSAVMGLDVAVPRYADDILASAMGLGADVISAYGAIRNGFPGGQAYGGPERGTAWTQARWHSFPGGNTGVLRCLVKRIIPDAIAGGDDLPSILEGSIRFEALDRNGSSVRIRLSATVVVVEEHSGEFPVAVSYFHGGRIHRVRARAVVMAGGGWSAQHALRELPDGYRQALAAMQRAPALVVNVALHNWRFLQRLGFSACRWFDGEFGFSCNIRRPMIVGGRSQPFHPDRPIVLTFCATFCRPGSPVDQQGLEGRTELLTTSFREYERRIRLQLSRLFGASGFDAERDIAGIILNRWGHAYVVPSPGFYFARGGRPSPRDVLRAAAGRVSFANSELRGHQTWNGAIEEGFRAMQQALAWL